MNFFVTPCKRSDILVLHGLRNVHTTLHINPEDKSVCRGVQRKVVSDMKPFCIHQLLTLDIVPERKFEKKVNIRVIMTTI